ncbi:hypothetical protein C356_04775 [Cryptococcus neoformans c45]|nr:hypothetical protein C356_04775 [Cryptococcus neoformans var. grubii c45]
MYQPVTKARVILHIHGGGHPLWTSFPVDIARATGKPCLSSSILLLAESAGGHLALLLSRYLRHLSLPQPGYIALSSPWADLSMSYPSYKLNKDYDTLCPPRLRTAVNSAMRYFIPAALKTEWFSPANAESKSWSYLGEEGVKVYIQYGGRELFRDEIVALAERMKGAEVETILRELNFLQLTAYRSVSHLTHELNRGFFLVRVLLNTKFETAAAKSSKKGGTSSKRTRRYKFHVMGYCIIIIHTRRHRRRQWSLFGRLLAVIKAAALPLENETLKGGQSRRQRLPRKQ